MSHIRGVVQAVHPTIDQRRIDFACSRYESLRRIRTFSSKRDSEHEIVDRTKMTQIGNDQSWNGLLRYQGYLESRKVIAKPKTSYSVLELTKISHGFEKVADVARSHRSDK